MDINTWANSIKDSFCITCLSKNRSLFYAKTMEQPLKLLPDLKIERHDKVCWECKAILKKINMFYKRAHAAQALFTTAVTKGVINNLQSLSNLKILDTESLSCFEHITDPENKKGEDKNDNLCIEFSNVTFEPEGSPSHSPGHGSETETCSEGEVLALLSDGINSQPLKAVSDATKRKTDRPSFDIKTGKYYKDIFKTVTLSDSEVAEIREKKLRNPLFLNNPKKCLKCVKSFYNDKALERHAVKHRDISGMFECKVCQQRWSTQQALDEHTKLHYTSYACLYCKQKFMDQQKVLGHYDVNHHPSIHQCKDCTQEFMTAKLLYRHRHKSHGTDFPCPQCNKTFKYQHVLNAHKRKHTQCVDKVECAICHKKYSSLSGLKTHTQVYHEEKVNEQAFCVECDAQFSTLWSYRTHLRTSLKHNTFQDMKFECDACGKRFASKGSLRVHLEYTHGEAQVFKCVHCASVFKRSKYLSRHILHKHEGIERPRNHVCHICTKAFHDKRTLEQHLYAHRGYRPFVCDICSADFSHSGAMYTHKKLKHGYKKKTIKIVNIK